MGILSLFRKKKKTEKFHNRYTEEDFRCGYMPDELNGVREDNDDFSGFEPIPRCKI